jgi:hypothetical protein
MNSHSPIVSETTSSQDGSEHSQTNSISASSERSSRNSLTSRLRASRASLLVLVFSQRSPLPRADRTKPANRYTVETWAARPNMHGSSVLVSMVRLPPAPNKPRRKISPALWGTSAQPRFFERPACVLDQSSVTDEQSVSYTAAPPVVTCQRMPWVASRNEAPMSEGRKKTCAFPLPLPLVLS